MQCFKKFQNCLWEIVVIFNILNTFRLWKIQLNRMNSAYIANLTRRALQAIHSQQFSSRKTAFQCDVAVVGGNLGAILANQLYYVLDTNKKIMMIHENSNIEFATHRPLYEQGKLQYDNNSLGIKNYVDSMIKCNKSGVKTFSPEQSKLILKNGQIIHYKNLVIAMGMHKNLSLIKGLQETLVNPNQQVYTSLNTSVDKKSKGCMNYNQIDGDTIFYIPPAPTSSIQNFNMFIFYNYWQKALAKTGKNFNFSLINANSSLCSASVEADNWLKGNLKDIGIQLTSGLKMTQVVPGKNQAIFLNQQTGEKNIKHFSKLYTLLPTDVHPSLQKAGLVAKNGLLDVDKQSLRHYKYDNIFGLGQVNNVPTTRSLYAGLSQLKIVRNNIQQQINMNSRQLKYSGYSSTPIIMKDDSISWLSHKYDNKLSVSTQNIEQFMHQKEQLERIYKMNLWKSSRIARDERQNKKISLNAALSVL